MRKIFALAPLALAIIITGCGSTTPPAHHQTRPQSSPSATATTPTTEPVATVDEQYIADTAAFANATSNLETVMGGWMPNTPMSTIRAQIAPILAADLTYQQQLVALAKVSPQPLGDDFIAVALREKVVSYELNKFNSDTTYHQVEETIYAVFAALKNASSAGTGAAIATGLEKG